jgi:hypothetical protein
MAGAGGETACLTWEGLPKKHAWGHAQDRLTSAQRRARSGLSVEEATEAMALGDESPLEDWASLPWRKREQRVYRLQRRIYRAAQCGNVTVVHSLQRLLLKSWSARC